MNSVGPRPEIKLDDPAASPLAARPPSRIHVILNAAAGSAGTPDICETVAAAFVSAKHPAHIVPAHSPKDVAAALAEACRARPDVIVAGGGDGTISTVAQGAVQAGIALGVLPLGTLNHFAKDMNIPLDIEGAVRVICAGRTAAIDVGEVSGGEGPPRIFLNNSSLGVYPRIVRHRDGQMRRHGRSKWLALAIATLTVLRVMPLFRFRIRIDGAEEDCRSSLLLIGNNDYVMDGLHFGERRRLDAGRLSFYAPRRRGRGGLLALAARALGGGLSRGAGFEVRSAREIVITPPQPHLQVAIDGEVSTMASPLVYRIRPRALRVMAP